MPIELPALPYAMDELAPHISAETLEYHYGKHHASYVTNLNKMLDTAEIDSTSLEQIIADAARVASIGRHVQQCGPDLESHVLLEQHDSPRWGRS